MFDGAQRQDIETAALIASASAQVALVAYTAAIIRTSNSSTSRLIEGNAQIARRNELMPALVSVTLVAEELAAELYGAEKSLAELIAIEEGNFRVSSEYDREPFIAAVTIIHSRKLNEAEERLERLRTRMDEELIEFRLRIVGREAVAEATAAFAMGSARYASFDVKNGRMSLLGDDPDLTTARVHRNSLHQSAGQIRNVVKALETLAARL